MCNALSPADNFPGVVRASFSKGLADPTQVDIHVQLKVKIQFLDVEHCYSMMRAQHLDDKFHIYNVARHSLMNFLYPCKHPA